MFKPIADNITAEDIKNRLLAYASLKAAQEEVDRDYWYGNISTYTLCLRLSGIYGEKQFNDVMTADIDETLNIGKYPYLENEVFLRETQHLDDLNFVKQLYQAFLAREADPGGLDGNVNQLQNGALRENLVIGLRSSGEADNVFLRVTECLDDRHFLEIAHRVYLQPENRAARWEQDLQSLDNGASRESVFQALKQFQQLQTALNHRQGDFYRSDNDFLANTQEMSDEEYVKELYLTYCKREADPGGLEGNVNRLVAGDTRTELLYDLRTSEEAANVFVDLTAGLDLPTFVKVAYLAFRKEKLTPTQEQQCLEILEAGNIRQTILREVPQSTEALQPTEVPQPTAIEEVVSPLELASQQILGSFGNSDEEFIAQTEELSNEEFIKQLYTTYLRREADPDGLSSNVAQLQEGASRAEILYGVRTSEEAANVFVELTQDLNEEDYLALAYQYFRKEELDPEQKNAQLSALASGTSRQTVLQNPPRDIEIAVIPEEVEAAEDSLEQLLADFEVEDQDYIAQRENLGDEEFVREVYCSFFRREADPEGLASHVDQLAQGVSRWEILYDLRTSPEAANVFVDGTQDLDNSQFLDTAYRVYLKKNLNPENKAAYLEYLDAGNPRQDILS